MEILRILFYFLVELAKLILGNSTETFLQPLFSQFIESPWKWATIPVIIIGLIIKIKEESGNKVPLKHPQTIRFEQEFLNDDEEDQPFLTDGTELSKGKYTIQRVITPGISSLPITPNTRSCKLYAQKPSTYLATVTRKCERVRKGERVIIKAVKRDKTSLENEERALKRLRLWRRFRLIPQIAPILVRKLTYDDTTDHWYIVLTKLGEGSIGEVEKPNPAHNWMSLKDIVQKGALIEKFPYNSLVIFKNRLIEVVQIMHRLNIVHGDLKPEHIWIEYSNREGKLEYHFDRIQIIDFGLCYTKHSDNWRGGSPGFCSPYFWNTRNRTALDQNQLFGLDWYSLYTVLYFAYTGELFPIATPAYRYLPDIDNENSKRFYDRLKNELKSKYCYLDANPKKILDEIIDRLSKPDDFSKGKKFSNI